MRDFSNFLAQTDWSGAAVTHLAGDASNRRYGRIAARTGKPAAVLMDSPPDKGEDIRPFINIANHLRDLGLSAPAIFAIDTNQGFLLLEDLGDDLYARVLERDPALELDLYKAATDVLIHLHKADVPPVERYDTPLMTDLACLAFDKYQAGVTQDIAEPARHQFHAQFSHLLQDTLNHPDVLILRDYHAENLLWLPERQGTARVGLLDFQDAMAGHPAYDLVSMLQDARRDVSQDCETQMIAHYIAQTGVDKDAFQSAYAVLGVQRNLRILGVFARLSLDYGRSGYVDLIPRVWAHLEKDLSHPKLSGLSDLLLTSLPKPSTDTLRRLLP